MGCEGYITIARIKDGHHLLLGDPKIPVFMIPVFIALTEVAVLPIFVENVRGVPSPTTRRTVFDQQLRQTDLGAAIWLPSMESPGFGLYVLTLKDFDRLRDSKEGFPGEVPEYLTRDTWLQIVPGYYVVTNYYESGTGDDSFHYSPRLSEGVELEFPIKWMIWT